MSRLVEQIGTSHTHQQHLQYGIFYEHSSHNGGQRKEAIVHIQRFRLAREQSHQYIGQHCQHIAKVFANVRKAVQPEAL